MRFAPVMLALLLALSPVAVATQAVAPTDGSVPSTKNSEDDVTTQAVNRNTTAVLTLGKEPQRNTFETSFVSLSSALATDRNEVDTQLSSGTLTQQIQSAEKTSRKKQLLNRYRYRIENRIIELESREKQAARAFNNGSISASEYARTLGRIDIEAGNIKKQVDTMQSAAVPIRRFRMETEANTLRGKLITLEGPVRDRIGRALLGQVNPTRVSIATADTGVVLATVVKGTYVREVTRHDRRNPGAQGGISISQAGKIVDQHYPWVANHSKGTGTKSFGTTNVFRRTMSHTQGELVAYLDGGTEAIFKEIQHKRLGPLLPTGPVVTNSSDDVTIVVNRTYPGGPLRVELTSTTGDPIDGTVTVAGEEIGRTGSDGILWTLGPYRQFRVSATHDFTTVRKIVRPTQPKAVLPNNSTKSATVSPA